MSSDNLRLRGYKLSACFQPKVKLTREKGFAFAEKLSRFMSITQVDVQADRWSFHQQEGEHPSGRLSVEIAPEALQIDSAFPTQAQEWHDLKQDAILDAFAEMFQPAALLRTLALVRCVLPIGKDAREFLVTEVMAIPDDRMRLLGRPIHVVGIRLACPPVPYEGKEGVELLASNLEVKIESLADDPKSVFLEVAINWPTPMKWDKAAQAAVRQAVPNARDYLTTHLLPMIGVKPEDKEDV